jgi:hypothetical protein
VSRAVSILILVVLGGLALLANWLGLFAPPAAHIAALVPEDAIYCVVSSSVNDLRELYVSKYQVTEFDPARARIGDPVNVPGLDGVDYERPVGVYLSRDRELVNLVPFTDLGAFEKAFDQTRENVNAKAPIEVAKHYLSVSESDAVATIGPDDRMILEASKHPLALVGRPGSSLELRAMLVALFGAERAPRMRTAIPLSALCLGMPEAVATAALRELRQFRLAVLPHKPDDPAVRFDLVADPGPQSQLVRAAEYATGGEAATLLGTLPAGHKMNTVAGAAVVLDAEGWRTMGMPISVGPAAGMIGVVTLKYRAGRQCMVFGLAPSDPEALDRIAVAPVLGLDPSAAQTIKLTGAELLLHRVKDAPSPFRKILSSEARSPPPLYLCTARLGGIWFCTLGAHAEEVMRAIVDGATGASRFVLRDIKAGVDKRLVPTALHPKLFRPGLLALGFLNAEAPRAIKFPIPHMQTASIGNPEAVTFTLAMEEDRLHADIRVFRAERQ